MDQMEFLRNQIPNGQKPLHLQIQLIIFEVLKKNKIVESDSYISVQLLGTEVE